MAPKVVPPSTTETGFSCPYCGVLTTQYWYETYAKPVETGRRIPSVSFPGEPIFTPLKYSKSVLLENSNLHVSSCFNCKKNAVWVGDQLSYPSTRMGPEPNADMPEELIVDFEEARTIVNHSPRGAAALLRLCIQKLCKHLLAVGRTIDEQIAFLVGNGLNTTVKKSLDIVRVIGNEAVHPGVIDLKDDHDTAVRLFELVNAISDQMISHPKKVDEMYRKLPPEKREAIDRRDSGAKTAD